ncbi:hypothetical protein TSTA_123710 [Talaromyces stipitatus ATCC 10500]|uniref:Uncharacterized protein n=1 Tax=Talaromyces stipitatus (strain ATCC 10500 / CBS 375.48 / QM 6759 / NRRL 1006) TaxID=441959 RepID=B8MAE0_TALSN|nr:uncharacterized protein TSTA_123710 [Talaromyces stipitatus ATCC 10500]EED18642.1 hypothetical protein TSTA_123710 [Talaromyces stipitatus ATCC 10500]
MSSKQKLNPLKRKASRELPPNTNRNDNTQMVAATTQADTKIHKVSSLYQQTYLETIAEIKSLLQHYAATIAADEHVNATNNSTVAGNGGTGAAAADARAELKAILDDLAQKPELVELDEVKTILKDCGIEICIHMEGGRKIADVWMV